MKAQQYSYEMDNFGNCIEIDNYTNEVLVYNNQSCYDVQNPQVCIEAGSFIVNTTQNGCYYMHYIEIREYPCGEPWNYNIIGIDITTERVHGCSENDPEFPGSGGGSNPGGGGGGGGNPPAPKDCSGVSGGSAYLDNCQQCVGGTTGKQQCQITILLTTSSMIVSLMDKYDLITQVASSTQSSFNVTNYKFEISRTGQGVWYTLYTGMQKDFERTARTSGIWDFRVTVTLNNGKTFTSNTIIGVEEQYPSYSEIVSNIAAEMSSYWNSTINYASINGRKEFGFWVYIDTKDGTYFCEDIPNNNVVSCAIGSGGSILPGQPKSYKPYFTPLEEPIEYVALFHTHTPLTYCPANMARQTGPSGSDSSYADIPSIVYDYIGTYDSFLRYNIIVGGHMLNDPANYTNAGINKKPTRLY